MSIDNQIDDVVNEIHGQTVVGGASVKNKLIDIIQTLEDKTVDSNAPMGAIVDELHDAIINGAGDENPKLYAPTISRSGDTINISNPSTNGGFATGYKIYNGDTFLADTTSSSFSISGLGKGVYELYVTATGEGFDESDKSNKIKASVFKITKTLENLSANNSSTLILNGTSYSVTLSPASGYYLPEDIVVTMGGKTKGIEYNSYTGVITISSVKGDIIIQAAALTTPKIRRPVVTRSGTTLSITPATYSESTKLYIDEQLIQTYTGTSAVTYDLSTNYSDYGIYEIAVKSEASGYDDSETVTMLYKVGATIAADRGVITISSIINGVTGFKVYVDDELIDDDVSYDGSNDWSLDMSDYEQMCDEGKHNIELCAVGTGIAENRSNPVTWFCGTAPIYGVSGLYASDPALTRTDNAVGMDFLINSSSGAVDSDFESVFPWNEAEVVTLDAGKFLRLPKMYFRIGKDSSNRITDIAVSESAGSTGDWYEVESFDVACYGASISGSALASATGQTRGASQTRNSFRAAAAATGTGYYQYDFYHHTVLQFLWLIEFATKDSASIMTGRINGSGTSGGNSARPTGGTDSVLTPSGFETAYAQMRYHYIEDFVGNLRECYDGIISNAPGSPSYVTTDPTKFSDTDKSNMSALSFNNANTSNGNCIAALGWDSDHPFFPVPIEVANDNTFTTYFCDGYYPLAGYPIAYGGASCGNFGANGGVFYVGTFNATYANASLGSRLLHSS